MEKPITKAIPITDLRKTGEISSLCHEVNAPIIVTKNGYSDLIIMTVETYERQMYEQSLTAKLAVAEAEIQAGATRIPFDQVMAEQRKKLHE